MRHSENGTRDIPGYTKFNKEQSVSMIIIFKELEEGKRKRKEPNTCASAMINVTIVRILLQSSPFK